MKRLLPIAVLFPVLAGAQVTISITPQGGTTSGTPWPAETVYPGAQRTWWSHVAGNANLLVDWSDNCGATPVTGTTYWNWTAPATAQTCTITAVAEADGVTSTTQQAVVIAENVSVAIMPFYEVVYKGQYIDLQSYVSGAATPYEGVTWSVSGPAAGTAVGGTSDRDFGWSSTTAGTYTITATSARDATKSASATIIVTGNAMPAITANNTQPIDCTCVGSGRCIDIGGNGSPYSTINSWYTATTPNNVLSAGDTMRIWQSGGSYHEQILFETVNSAVTPTATDPIRVCGVRSGGISDSGGSLPEINGALATAANPNDAIWGSTLYGMQQYGIWPMYNGNGAYYASPPNNIVVEGLKIVQAEATDKYVLRNTSTQYYYNTVSSTTPSSTGSACLYIESGQDIVIRGMELSTCGAWGLFTNGRGAQGVNTYRLTAEGNYIHNNGTAGIPGSSSLHNNYLQSDGVVYQWNYVGPLVTGGQGSAYKTRSGGLVDRYNYIFSGARAIDHVEPQDSAVDFFTYIWWPYHISTPGDPWTTAQVASTEEHLWNIYDYGNMVYNNGYCGNCVHYGFDQVAQQAQGGTMWFYYNSFLAQLAAYPTGPYAWTLWDDQNAQGQGTLPPTFPHAQLSNNIVYRLTASGSPPYFQWAYTSGAIGSLQGKNWIDAAWGTGNTTPGYGANCEVTPSPSSQTWQNTSGLCNISNVGASYLVQTGAPPFNTSSFVPMVGSGAIGAAGTQPSQLSSLPPKFMFNPLSLAVSPRTTITDIGAMPYIAGTLYRIVISPASATLLTGGNTQQFAATGDYSDGSTADVTTSATWTSSATGVATVGASTGLATSGATAGNTTISATIGSITGTASLDANSVPTGTVQGLAVKGLTWK